MDESEILKNMAKALGPEAESTLKELELQEEKKLREKRLLEALNKLVVDNKEHEEVIKQEIEEVIEAVNKEVIEEDLQQQPQLPVKDIVTPGVVALSVAPQQNVQRVADTIPGALRKELDIIKKSVADFHRFASRMSQMGGGGEVNFRWLDDVNRDTMTSSNDNWVLEYDAASKKVQFTKDIGAIDSVLFDVNHIDIGHPPGTLTWNTLDRTLNIDHPGGVSQQVGQEQYFLVKNSTGSPITNGTFCQFAGATGVDGEARLLAAPMLANGTYPNLYGMGVANQTIADGQEGFITVFGKVRGLNTTGSSVSETWVVGDILYAHPTIAGALTKVKPTAPNNVLPVAAVLNVSATAGELFVRPTIEQRAWYGSFSDTTDQLAANTNTPYAVRFNTTDIANGHRVDSNTRIVAVNSGLYNYQFSLQLVSTNASQKDVFIWARKNGADIPNSTSKITVIGNGTALVAAWNYIISMNANSYFQLMWATSDTTVRIDAPTDIGFAPDIPSAILTVTEVAL